MSSTLIMIVPLYECRLLILTTWCSTFLISPLNSYSFDITSLVPGTISADISASILPGAKEILSAMLTTFFAARDDGIAHSINVRTDSNIERSADGPHADRTLFCGEAYRLPSPLVARLNQAQQRAMRDTLGMSGLTTHVVAEVVRTWESYCGQIARDELKDHSVTTIFRAFTDLEHCFLQKCGSNFWILDQE
ncbi:hypothetical protein BS50DRAFT_627421 [Corynespora cassiicola Philippines]|uniref:Uncharacterized protein n=1 Tax=Corynespora cassiicola Philippines TaxID=1448308 RepID=A0A2T2P8S1_CORCC|nr:hypothetical protein BS50DRAFT_627421 [Corynespora cassiicola Philippines]